MQVQPSWPPAGHQKPYAKCLGERRGLFPSPGIRHRKPSSSSAAEQLAHFGADVSMLHQRLAHQYGLRAALRQSLDIRASVDAAFGDQERRCVARCCA